MTKMIELFRKTISLWVIDRKIHRRNKLSSKLRKQELDLLKSLEEYNKRYLY